MRADTASRLAQSIQLLQLDKHSDYTLKQLADASGINRKTVARNQGLIDMLEFALDHKEYDICILQL